MPDDGNIINIDTIKKEILPFFNLTNCDVTMIKFKDTDKQRAVFKIDSGNNFFCLKKVYYNESDLLFVYSAMEWLFRNNVNVPKLLPTLNNNRFVYYNDMIFILTPWVIGEKCSFDSLSHLRLAATTLGKLHKCSKNFEPIIGSSRKIALQDYSLSTSKHFNEILYNANLANNINDRFSKIFLSNLNTNLDLAKLSLEISSSMDNSNLSKSLCHGDYVNKNIIITKNKDLWIIDFDKCSYDYCAHDIAYFLRRLLKRKNTNWNAALTLDILNNYCKVNTLTSSDFKYILSYLAFPQKFWKLSRDYYKSINKFNKNTFISIFQRSTERSNYQLDYIKNMMEILTNYYDVKF